MYADISNLIGKIVASIEEEDGGLVFKCFDGEIYKMYHEQDCCECVEIEEIIGDINDLIGAPIIVAEEIFNEAQALSDDDESFTWTFYKFATIKGWVDIRWYGTSNGYYSESVSFIKVKGDKTQWE